MKCEREILGIPENETYHWSVAKVRTSYMWRVKNWSHHWCEGVCPNSLSNMKNMRATNLDLYQGPGNYGPITELHGNMLPPHFSEHEIYLVGNKSSHFTVREKVCDSEIQAHGRREESGWRRLEMQERHLRKDEEWEGLSFQKMLPTS